MPVQFFSRMISVRNRFLTMLGVVLLASCGPTSAPVSPQPSEGAVLAETGRVYALVETQQTAADLQSAARDLGYLPQDTIDLDGLGLIMVPVDLPDGVMGGAAIAALELAVPSSTVGVNHAYRLQQTDAVSNRRAYANDLMQWPDGGCRAQVAIGLIDGGIDRTAPMLAGVNIFTRDFAVSSVESVRHGTEVASVMVDPSRITNVSLYSASVIATNEDGEDLGGAAALVQAIDWMARQNVTLVNVSLAGPPNKLLSQAVEAAAGQGVQLVAAVGNTGRAAPPQHPAALPRVFGVTAVDARSRVFRDAVRGPQVDFAAPGVDVFVASADGGRYVSGTSMAAPFITAFLATQTRRDPQALIAGALDLGPVGRDATFGYGLIQAEQTCR